MANIADARALYPYMADLDDEQVIEALHTGLYRDLTKQQVADALGYKAPPPPPLAARTMGEAVTDSGRSVLSGLAGLVKSGGDMYGLASGNMDNMASELGKNAQEYWTGGQTQQLKDKIAARKDAIDSAETLPGKFGTAVKETLTDPALIADTVFSNVATILPGAAVARPVMAAMAARGLATAAAVGPLSQAATAAVLNSAAKVATGVSVGVGAVQQGTDVASQAYDDAMKKTAFQLSQNPEFVARVQVGEVPKDVAMSLGLSAARAAFLPGAAISVATNALPGGTMLERALLGGAARDTLKAGVKFGTAKAMAKAAAGEGIGETFEEGGGQFAANLAKQRFVDPNQNLEQDVGENAGLGFAGGFSMGAAGGALHRPQSTVPVEAPAGPLGRAANLSTPVAPQAPVVAPTTLASQIDPVMDRINLLPEVARNEAIAAYAVMNDPETPRAALKQNTRILEEHLAKLAPEPPKTGPAPESIVEIATNTVANETPQGQFKTPQEVADYISLQRRTGGGARMPAALPIEYPDNSFGVATEGGPDFVEAERQQSARALIAAGVKDGDLLTPSNQPFRTKMSAGFKAKTYGGEVVAVDGGFVVRPTPKDADVQDTPPVAAAEVKAAPVEAPKAAPPVAAAAVPAGAAAGSGVVEAAGVAPTRQQATDSATSAASKVLASGGSRQDAMRAATDVLIDRMAETPDIEIAQDGPAAVEAAEASQAGGNQTPVTIKDAAAKLISDMSDAEVLALKDHYSPDHKRAPKIAAEIEKRGLNQAKPLESIAPDASESVAESVPKSLTPKAAREAFLKQRDDYFTPGNIVKSYGGHDEVLSYTPAAKGKPFSVTVRAVVQRSNMWVTDPNDNRARQHSTEPEAAQVKSGPVDRLAPPAAPEVPVTAPPVQDKPAAAGRTPENEALIELRKRQGVLKLLLKCLG